MHVLSGQWPFPGEAVRVNPRNPNDPNDLVGVTEFDRREEYINKINNQHPLMHLIQLCLSNSPSHRPTSCEVHQQVSAVSAEHPASFTNRVEMLERIKALGEEKEARRLENNNAVAESNEKIAELSRERDKAVREKEQVATELEKTQCTVEKLQQSHSIELEGVQLEVSDLKAENAHLQTIVNAKENELDTLKKYYQTQLELKASELSSKDALISSKSRTIESLQQKLGQALETSSSSKNGMNVFSPGLQMNFIECAELPMNDGFGQACVVDNEVYVGFTNYGNVLKYQIVEDVWKILPKTPAEYFSITHLLKHVLIIGGVLPSEHIVTGDVHEFDDATQQWVRSTSIPPMLTARKLVTAVSWTSPPALIVCGGSGEKDKPMTVVEVYHSSTSQWHTVSHLPFPRDGMSHTIIHNVLYLVGGYRTCTSLTRTVVSASIPQLLESFLQPSGTPPVQWQSGSIPDTPHYWSTAASLGECLLVVGGSKKPIEYLGKSVSSVCAYCPSSSSWVHVGNLPQPLAKCITVTLPTGELLVLGGKLSQDEFVRATYKCCLC